jgi:hypothetical protein
VPAVSSPAWPIPAANVKEREEMSDLSTVDALRTRAAKNQSLFRIVNEGIEDLAEDALFTTFICECLDDTCDEHVALALEEYEHIRSVPNRFFVLEGHEMPAVEDVVESTDRYLVVEKIGLGAEIAVDQDPRAHAEFAERSALNGSG